MPKPPTESRDFSRRLLRWHTRHGRHGLPWQRPRTAYRVWLSEVMLQQTQVVTVIPYFRRFVARFPTLASLAQAPADDVLALWSGLGYYARARNLQRAAQQVVAQHGGRFPRTFAAVTALPGIGRSTAGAILAQAFDQRHPILDGNVRRVLSRWRMLPVVQPDRLWALAEALLPQARLADYTQALMDLGATVCTARDPGCARCPVRRDCRARLAGRIADFPARRARAPRPQRRAQLLLAQDSAGAILLERRPPRGIWGALWCPPLLADESLDAALQRLQLRPGARRQLAERRHSFTHFDLDLAPVHVQARAQAPPAPGQAWVTLVHARSLGLPAPVRKLLNECFPS